MYDETSAVVKFLVVCTVLRIPRSCVSMKSTKTRSMGVSSGTVGGLEAMKSGESKKGCHEISG